MRKKIVCKECGQEKYNHGHGVCHTCYMRIQMRDRRAKFPEVFHKQDRERWHGERREKCNKSRKERYYKNYDEERRRQKLYLETHREEIRQQQKEYYQRNLEVIRAKNREYNKRRDTKKELARLAAWQKRQPVEKLRKIWRRQSQIRIARKNNLPATLTVSEWEEIKMSYDNRCAYCGEQKVLVQEHKTPIVRGGGYIKDNIIPACVSCNSKKGKRTYDEYMKIIEREQ